ncbi:MAG: BatA domain-containing protein, partial [Beijerinckiaceae bacterium]
MIGLPLAFTVPLVLAALAALPVLYWLLRMTPPPPNRAVLPTLPLVRDLDPREETPARTPWWLLLLRLLLAALVILAMAGPLWNPDPEARVGRGPLLVVIDDSWSAAPDWKLRTERAAALMESAGASGRAVVLRPVSADPVDIVPGAAARALDQLRSLQPRPHSLDRKRQEQAVRTFAERNAEGAVAWITDGVSALDDRDALARLASTLGDRLVVYAADQPGAFGLAQPLNQPDALTVRVLRAATSGTPAVSLRALDARGRAVAEGSATFPADGLEALARIEAPLEIRNDVARIDIVGHASAGAVTLLDGRNKRRRVGIVSGETVDTAQPLLSSQYFISRALGPYADVREAPRGAPDPVGRLIEDGARAIILADVGTIAGPTLEKLTAFVDGGGVLIRFASRRVAAPTDKLLPVRLRRSERVMGGALSWDTPRKLASFAVDGPFGGLAIPADVTVTQQVLAEPEAALTEKIWAALEDGTPLITGERRGKGVVALFHVTADTGWSSLPLSAAFVETLRRLSALASTDADAAAGDTQTAEGAARAAATLAPLRQLDGFGTFQPPAATTEPAPRNFIEPASARHPPGFYGTA